MKGYSIQIRSNNSVVAVEDKTGTVLVDAVRVSVIWNLTDYRQGPVRVGTIYGYKPEVVQRKLVIAFIEAILEN